MEPERMIVSLFQADIPSWQGPDGIVVSRELPGWLVKFGDRAILLPAGWDTTLSEWFAGRQGKPIIVEGASFWPLCKFGAGSSAGSFAFREGVNPLEILGEHPFGTPGAVTQGGHTISFLVVDCRGQEVTLMQTGTVRAKED